IYLGRAEVAARSVDRPKDAFAGFLTLRRDGVRGETSRQVLCRLLRSAKHYDSLRQDALGDQPADAGVGAAGDETPLRNRWETFGVAAGGSHAAGADASAHPQSSSRTSRRLPARSCSLSAARTALRSAGACP